MCSSDLSNQKQKQSVTSDAALPGSDDNSSFAVKITDLEPHKPLAVAITDLDTSEDCIRSVP